MHSCSGRTLWVQWRHEQNGVIYTFSLYIMYIWLQQEFIVCSQ